MKLGRTSLFHFLTQVVTSIAGFLTTLIIARLLGASVLGTFAVATSLSVILTIPANTISGAMSKRISEREEPSAYFTAGTVLLLGMTVIVGVGLLIAGPLVNSYLGAPVVELLVLLIAASTVYNIYTSILTGEKKVFAAGALGTVEQVLRLLFQASLIVAGFSLAGLFVGKIASLSLAAIVGIFISDMRLVMPDRRHFRRIYDFAKYTWMNEIKGRSFSWMDVIILGFFVDSALIGIYEVSWTLASTLILVSQSVQQTLFPEISELGVTEDYDRVRHLVDEAFVFVGIFAIPGLFGAVVLGDALLTIYRPVFAKGHLILVLLVSARLLDAYASQLINVLGALDYPNLVFWMGAAFTAVNVSLNVLLIWQFGWTGAAVATATAAFVELAIGYYLLSSVVGRLSVPYRQILLQVLVSAVMAEVLYVLTWFVPVTNYTVVGLVFAGAGLYVLLLIGVSTRIRRKTWMLAPGLDPKNVG